MQLKTIPDRF